MTAAYSQISELYIKLLGSIDVVDARDLDIMKRWLGNAAGPVLDLGCGPGHLTAYLRTITADVTGIDPVPEFLDHARRTYPHVLFEQGAIEDLVRPAATAAGALSWFSLIHVEPVDMHSYLQKVRTLLKPAAPLILGFFEGERLEPFAHKVTRAFWWPVDVMAQALADAGFLEAERHCRAADGERRAYAVLVAQPARTATA